MLTEFATLQFSREELLELHAALLQRAMLEDELRKERGLEKIDRQPLLERIEALLGERPERLDELDKRIEDELWEFAWYVYTDEWAWFRAGQEAGAKPESKTESKALTERLYRENFDRYVAEIDMRPDKKNKTQISRQDKSI